MRTKLVSRACTSATACPTLGNAATQRAADLHVIHQRHLLAVQRLRVLAELRRRFYQVVVAEERVRTAQRIGEIAAQISQAIQSRFEKGEVARVEVFEAEILQEQAAIDIEQERQSLEQAWALLAAVVGLPQLERRPLLVEEDSARTVQLDWATWESRILNENPELLAARSAVEIARAELLAATAQKVPEIELEMIMKHHNTNGYNSVSVALGIPVPVFDTRRGAILSAEASLREAEANLRPYGAGPSFPNGGDPRRDLLSRRSPQSGIDRLSWPVGQPPWSC